MYACPQDYVNPNCVLVNTFGQVNGQFYGLALLAVDQI